jgi:hypothetical protein
MRCVLCVQEFYLGELHLADRANLPMGGKEPPSADFLQQLRQYAGQYRMPEPVFHSHLGGRS